jgi:cysteine desulfurase
MAANNETGVLQPVGEVADMVGSSAALFHCDAVQAAGKIPLSFSKIGCDFMSLSAHKIGGPAGVGALVIRKQRKLRPLLFGGSQEQCRRAGTENLSGIAGFGAAAAAAARDLPSMAEMEQLRDSLEQGLRDITPGTVIFGSGAGRLPNTSCFSLPGTSAETLLMALDLDGIAVSSGAACSSGKVGSSHVLPVWAGIRPARMSNAFSNPGEGLRNAAEAARMLPVDLAGSGRQQQDDPPEAKSG